jgi:HSP20 family protein
MSSNMSTLDQLQQGVERAWSTLSEGWQYLWQRAAHALTRFTPSARRTDVETLDEQVLQRVARWGVLAAEVTENADNVQVRLEVPGMERDDFDIDVVGDTLVIRGDKHLQRVSRSDRYHIMECAYGRFERALPLPMAVQADAAKASYRRGVLTVILPKPAGNKRRRIEVEKRP